MREQVKINRSQLDNHNDITVKIHKIAISDHIYPISSS
jgi:hypothetical protein